MAETLTVKALAERLYQRDAARDGAETKSVSRLSHDPSPGTPRETPVRRGIESDGEGATSPAVTKAAPHPWFTAEAARVELAADTGLTIDELDRDWPASAWRRLYAARVRFWTMPRSDTLGKVTRHLNGDWIAWGDLQNRWHKRHGERPAAGLCAGCGEPIGDAEALTLSGAQTHLGRDPDCLLAYGKKWRAAADAGLKAMGLSPPTTPGRREP